MTILDIKYPECSEETAARLRECEAFIAGSPEKVQPQLIESWQHSFEILERLGANSDGGDGSPGGAAVTLWLDFAPLSFMWRAGGLVGGLIYHGPHDGFGSGSGPTYSVSFNRTLGWQIHT